MDGNDKPRVKLCDGDGSYIVIQSSTLIHSGLAKHSGFRVFVGAIIHRQTRPSMAV